MKMVYDLSRENFLELNRLHQEFLTKQGLNWQDKRGEFVSFRFSDNNFVGFNFEQSIIDNCVMENCSFVGCNFDESLIRGTTFKNCEFKCCSFRKCKFMYNTLINTDVHDIEGLEMTIDRCKFRLMKSNGCRFNNSVFNACYFFGDKESSMVMKNVVTNVDIIDIDGHGNVLDGLYIAGARYADKKRAINGVDNVVKAVVRRNHIIRFLENFR